MKSIVLCERTLVQESEDISSLKEEIVTEEGNEKTEEKKKFNSTSKSKNLEVDKSNEDGNMFRNGDKTSDSPVEEEVSGIDENKHQSSLGLENIANENFFIGETNSLVENEQNSLFSDKDERVCVGENLSNDSEVLENLSSEDCSTLVENSNAEIRPTFSVENNESSNDAIQIVEDKLDQVPKDMVGETFRKSFDTDTTKEELKNTESKENLQPLNDIILDMDENKENEKGDKIDRLKEYSSKDLLNKSSDGCEIQVAEVQTITGLEKDSMWADNDVQKSDQCSKEKSEEKLADDCQDICVSNDVSMITTQNEKEESQECVNYGNVGSESEENLEDGMHIEVEESEGLKIEDKENEQAELDNFSDINNLNSSEPKEDKSNYFRVGDVVSRKRQMLQTDSEDTFAKKKKIEGTETDQVQVVEESTEDSSRCRTIASLNVAPAPSEGPLLPPVEADSTKRTTTDDKDSKTVKESVTQKSVDSKKLKQSDAVLSVLEKFRGTLKTLTRSDLEELIVQKLCEVITERSNVGELRRKAQVLEQDQERWKAKAQSLTKQMKEMEMVMKKYMSEVQKQLKEGDTHIVTPLKVTRSVGLQVSFFSSANKQHKPNLSQTSPSSSLLKPVNVKSSKGPPPKLPTQFSPTPQNLRNKTIAVSATAGAPAAPAAPGPVPGPTAAPAVAPAPTSVPAFQKGSPPLQTSLLNHRRRLVAPKPDYKLSSSNRNGIQQSTLNNSRGPQNQVSRPNYKPISGGFSQKQQQQSQHQSGSKVIDLTDDDDRQTGSTIKTSGPIRVVSQLAQPSASQNNRFAYLLPTTSAPTGHSVGQSRQVLIATPTVSQPNRQIMCSMPPLLFKGGNVQSACQTQLINQGNKVILPKPLRHPAPLPQRPINQNTRPSLKLLPPRPALKISKVQTGIVLSWNMSLSQEHAPIASYQLYAYQESESPPATSLWKKVGDVKALPLPMACTLTQFMSGHKYHFAVRAVDHHSRIGPFSFPGTIVLV